MTIRAHLRMSSTGKACVGQKAPNFVCEAVVDGEFAGMRANYAQSIVDRRLMIA